MPAPAGDAPFDVTPNGAFAISRSSAVGGGRRDGGCATVRTMRARLWVIPVAVIALLAGLNLRSVSRLREADATHMRLVARQRAEGFEQEFDRELGRAYDLFNTEPSSLRGEDWVDFLTEYESWQD